MPNVGASPRGYHYLNEYQNCPRRFYLHHIQRLEPLSDKESLILGRTWHALLALQLGPGETGEFELVQGDYFKETSLGLEAAREQWERITTMLPRWRNKVAETLGFVHFEDLLPLIDAVEKDITLQLPSGRAFTARLDCQFHLPDGRHFVMEHKSTTWYPQKVIEGVDLEDQVTGYFAADYRDTPSSGVLVDVTGLGERGGVETAIIYRSRKEVADFFLEVDGLFAELEEKEKLLSEGVNPRSLYPRNGAWCAMFGCPYVDICRVDVEDREFEGFTRGGGESSE